MIIKSSSRSKASELASHLTNSEENEIIDFSDTRGLLAKGVHDALEDMELLSKLSPYCQKHLYHVSINPEEMLRAEDWKTVWKKYEAEFGLTENAFIEVTHIKQGREHKHRVYERVRFEDGQAVSLPHTYQRNEKIARILEYELGQPLTLGKHNRSVMKRLQAEGRDDVVEWMQGAEKQSRPVAIANSTDQQQAKRTGITVAQVRNDLKQAYENSQTGAVFSSVIAERGYLLVRGDRRDFVIVDRAGGVHSPRRRLGVKAKELRDRWQDIDYERLPSVKEVQPQRIKRKSLDGRRAAFQKEQETVLREIVAVEEERRLYREQQQKNSQPLYTEIAKAGSQLVTAYHNVKILEHCMLENT